jgi:hypothetical protein
MTAAWTLGAWPPVLWQPGRDTRPPHFVHLGTHVSPRLDSRWPRMGQTAWGGRAGDSAAGLSWDWIEIADGVVAVADPMTMTSNLRVLGTEGEVLTAHSAAPHLNRLLHGLPWQAEVRRAIAEAEAHAERALMSRPSRQRSGSASRPMALGFAA